MNLGGNDEIIYLDESGYNLYTRRSQGRAPVGDRVRQVRPGSRESNVNLCLAINGDVGVVFYELFQMNMNYARFQFLDNMYPVAQTICFRLAISFT